MSNRATSGCSLFRHIANPYRFIGNYIVIVCDEQTDVENTTALCLEKALAFQAHIVLFGNWLTIDKISDIVLLAEKLKQRSCLSYALSDSQESQQLVCQNAMLVLSATPIKLNG